MNEFLKVDEPPLGSDPSIIARIFAKTRTIAVVGLSPKPEKDSHRVALYLQTVGYRIIPVYPKEDVILGEKVYRSLSEIEGKVDMVDIFRKNDHIPAVVDEALARGDVECIWIQLGLVNNEAARRALAAGLKVIQNRCTKVEHQKLHGKLF